MCSIREYLVFPCVLCMYLFRVYFHLDILFSNNGLPDNNTTKFVYRCRVFVCVWVCIHIFGRMNFHTEFFLGAWTHTNQYMNTFLLQIRNSSFDRVSNACMHFVAIAGVSSPNNSWNTENQSEFHLNAAESHRWNMKYNVLISERSVFSHCILRDRNAFVETKTNPSNLMCNYDMLRDSDFIVWCLYT